MAKARRKPIRHRIDIYKDHRYVMAVYFRNRFVSWAFHTLLHKSAMMADGEVLGRYNAVYIE